MNEQVQYRFADATFLPDQQLLVKDDAEVQLEQKVSELLLAFCRRPGQTLTKNWLLEEVWPDRVVNEDSLSVAVSKLRRALGDSRGDPAYIRTVTGTGYVWLPKVERVETPEESPRDQPPANSAMTRFNRRFAATALLVLALAAATLWVLTTDPSSDEASAALPPDLQALHLEARGLVDEASTAEAYREAIAKFRRIIEQEPEFVAAYLGIAEAKLELSALGGHLDIELYADEVHALLDHVLSVDPDNARAWLRKGEVNWFADWDLTAAEAAYIRAIELAPEDPINYLPYTEFLITVGRFDEAEALMVKLRAANPDYYRYLNMSYVYLMRGELEQALAETRRLYNSEAGGDREAYHKMLHRIGLLLGDETMAWQSLEWLLEDQQVPAATVAEYGAIQRTEGIQALFARLMADRPKLNLGHYRPPIALARYAVVAGDTDAALHWLEQAIEERQPQAMLIDVDPHYLPLRNNPGFQALLDRLPGHEEGAGPGNQP